MASPPLLKGGRRTLHNRIHRPRRIHAKPIVIIRQHRRLPNQIASQPARHYGIVPEGVRLRLVGGHAKLLEEDGFVRGFLGGGVRGDPVDAPEGFVGCLAP